MFTDLFDAIVSLRPGAQFVLRENYDGLEWLDEVQTKPTQDEVTAEISRLQLLKPAKVASENRRAAYISESDPLFFKWQAGEATQEKWAAKRQEIKERFPKE